MMERTVLFYDFHRQYRMPRSQNVLRLGQNRSLGPTGPRCVASAIEEPPMKSRMPKVIHRPVSRA
ncbi:hypothetical protein DM480_17750 (plasmid) [Sphingomonas sp. FARSPH]|nr:hypothetical protein DM480_17750 [Sphingomonas sp. FARSPH]